MDFESFLKGKMSIEEMVAGFEETIVATVEMLLQEQTEPQAVIDTCVDEDSDVIFIDIYCGDASFKEV